MKISWPLVHHRKGEHPWVTYSRQLIYEKNKCMNLVVIGEPGNGKSWGLLSYFYMIDPDFDLDKQLCFRGERLLQILDPNRPREELKGKPVMFDESGIDLYNLKWRDNINTHLNNFFQTGRSLNYIFGMTVPYLSFVSSPVRKLMTHKMIAEGWSKDNKSKFLGYKLEWNDEKKKFYKKKLHVYYKDSKSTVGSANIRFPLAPRDLLKEYEKRKKEFQKEIRDQQEKEIASKKAEEEEKIEKVNLIKTHEFAKEIGINNGTMFQWIHSKKINAKRIGKLWFITHEERKRILNTPNLLNL